MSDHRFEIKVQFSIYGEEFEWEASLNWDAHNGGIDSRIAEWFERSYEEARGSYDMANAVEDARRSAVQTEQAERAELARLLTKYRGIGMKADAPASPDPGL